ncbi:MAG: hypothetical protein Q9216_001099 [Gyalolechia sp. 2 TL-2023]
MADEAEEEEADARLTHLCEQIGRIRDEPKERLTRGLSDAQIAEIKRVYGKSFRTCRPHFEHAFRSFFTVWWPRRLEHYGRSFVMESCQRLRIKLVMAGIIQFLENQWLGVGDHGAEEVLPMRPLVQYYRSKLVVLMCFEEEDKENGITAPGEKLNFEEYRETICELVKEAIPEDDRKELLNARL